MHANIDRLSQVKALRFTLLCISPLFGPSTLTPPTALIIDRHVSCRPRILFNLAADGSKIRSSLHRPSAALDSWVSPSTPFMRVILPQQEVVQGSVPLTFVYGTRACELQ